MWSFYAFSKWWKECKKTTTTTILCKLFSRWRSMNAKKLLNSTRIPFSRPSHKKLKLDTPIRLYWDLKVAFELLVESILPSAQTISCRSKIWEIRNFFGQEADSFDSHILAWPCTPTPSDFKSLKNANKRETTSLTTVASSNNLETPVLHLPLGFSR